MKHRFIVLIILFFCIAPVLDSCSTDKPDDVEALITEFVTCMTDSQGHIRSFKNDMGNTYDVDDRHYRLPSDTLFRCICTYSIGDGNGASIRNLYETDCSKATEYSSLVPGLHKFDAFDIESAYVGGGYLNVVVIIRIHDKDAMYKHHCEAVYFDSADSTVFSISHNSGEDTPVISRKLYYCIPLAGYGLEKNDTVFFKYRNYNEEDCIMKFVYR
ncbi:MAG: hypothetical protein MJY58_01570 [Bacteroidaceae bacterium]|nr:hypothetical protein [Bacteroidaceae bacterium]